jgi:anthranilate synthase/aminodeoxychorismate synthase-like glutamine amidotransferase
MSRIVVIDNYDSFTFNLVQYLGELGARVTVLRNDLVTVSEVLALKPQGILLSPGPSTPNEAGICLSLLDAVRGLIPTLGVCLGHQALGQAFGGTVVRNHRIVHGKASLISHTGTGVFTGLPKTFSVGRYHSLVVDKKSLPRHFTVTSETAEGEIMGLKLNGCELEGVQFHPESVLTEHGHQLLGNWLKLVARKGKVRA